MLTSIAPDLSSLEQLALPRLSAVDALEEAAFFARSAVACRSRRRTRCRDSSDECGFSEIASELPKPTCVHVFPASDRLVHAVAGNDVAADARLAHADEHDVRVRLGHRHRADRRAVDLAVGHSRPLDAAVRRLPESPAGGPEVRLLGTSLHARHRDGSPAAERADAAPLEGAQDRLVDAARRVGLPGTQIDVAGRSSRRAARLRQ